ncbi:MAG TPA: NosD domain-containing protein, partial [Candidatus Bathyarchaeia archaeon]|nr:NosD domain-containing protein [Candidatus Bathyarchaeia archaeon]
MTWQVGITFDNNSLKCTNAWAPETDPSYVFYGKTQVQAVDLNHQNAFPPQVVLGASLLDPSQSVTIENGLLCMLNFTGFKVGERSRLIISFLPNAPSSETFLSDSYGSEIPFETETFLVNLLEGTVVPDNYPTIQSAINSVNSGDSVLVRRGTYHENVVVNKTVAIIGEDRANTVIDGSGAGYVFGIKGANNVSVCNFTIQNGQTGVYVGDWGALIESSRGNVINNVITTNVDHGVFIDQSNYTVSGNVIENNGIGLSVFSNGAVNGTFRNNDVRNNSRYNLDLNSTVYDFLDLDTTNLVDGKPVYFWLRRLDETIPSNAGQVTLVGCSSIIVQGLDLEKNSVNVQFVKSLNCTLEDSNLSSANVGVLLIDSRNCTVDNNTLTDCIIDLQVQGGTNNTFTGNYLWINGFCGIDFGNTANNSFYHNTLNNLGATYTVYQAGLNIWDNGYPSGGNFWTDYVGVDLKRGPDQDINGSDQIGDTPYIIDANNSDHYPLVPEQSATPVHNFDSGLDYESIQAAIEAQETLNGHTVLVDAGTYYEHLTLSKSVSLVGEGSSNTVIDGSSSGAVINITAS